MINVGNDWVIGIDPLNYMVSRNKPKDRVRDGVTSDSYPWEGFFHTLEDALEYIRSEMIRDGLSEDMTLADAIRVIRETDAEFRKLIEEVAR